MQSRFIDYVLSFYGPNGIYASELDPPFNREECEDALQKYLQMNIIDFDGDSIDRENLRDIVLISRGDEPWVGGFVNPSFLREQLHNLHN
ncbi:MAG: hypothetical protein VW829_14115 [Deltaproteobacteria bacterium]